MQIVPAIDIYGGTCVRLSEGEFDSRKDYEIVPRDKAEQFRDAGAHRLHVVDLEGAKEGKVVNWPALTALLKTPGLDIQVGGGIRTADDITALLELGARRVVIGSMAVSQPDKVAEWIGQFGPDRFCFAVDVRDGVVATHGWQDSGGGPTVESLVKRLAEAGVKDYLSTDIRRDGMMAGPNIQLYESLVTGFPDLRWLASGGVRSIADVATLKTTGVYGVIIGKALYEQAINLTDLFKMYAHS